MTIDHDESDTYNMHIGSSNEFAELQRRDMDIKGNQHYAGSNCELERAIIIDEVMLLISITEC